MKHFLLLLTVNILAVCVAAQQSTGGQRQRSTESEIVVTAIPDQIYTGAAIMPELIIKDGEKTLVKGVDYTLVYAGNVEIGRATVTIQGKGNYVDTKDVYFNIVAKSLQVSPIPDQMYRGAAIIPEVVVKDGTKTLRKDTDYTVACTNNINVGTANITITGKGAYKESKQATFKIIAKSIKSSRATPPARPSSNESAQSVQQQSPPPAEQTATGTRTKQTFNRR
ncbi:MAG: hypothetical protein LBB41_04760 [Prevotellaceae bacterium]|jgi:hypothetical protein|nr:hypothetical protein [Prevotellaceae bacterium]